MRPSPVRPSRVYLGARKQTTIDALLAADILTAIDFLVDPSEDTHWWFGEECYRNLRATQWSELQNLKSKLEEHAGTAPVGDLTLSERELELAGNVVECASVLEAKDIQKAGNVFDRIGGVVAIGVGLLTIIALVR